MVRFGVYDFVECSVLTQSNESVFERVLLIDPELGRFTSQRGLVVTKLAELRWI